jgi:choice-of-anchor A domain-containing protein
MAVRKRRYDPVETSLILLTGTGGAMRRFLLLLQTFALLFACACTQGLTDVPAGVDAAVGFHHGAVTFEGIDYELAEDELDLSGHDAGVMPDNVYEEPDPMDAETFFGFSPWEFNVVVLEDLGTSCSPYCSDFQGAAAVGGDVYLSGFSLNDLDAAPADMGLYAGGDVTFTGALSHGGMEVTGEILLPGTSVDGSVFGGGDMDGSGTVGGDVTLAGDLIPMYSLTVGGTLTEYEPFVSTLDLHVLGVYFQTASSTVAGKTPTLTATDAWGEIRIEAVQGMNVVEIDAQTLNDAWGIRIDGPADASLYIDVPDATASLDSLVWAYDGDLGPERTLLNYGAATDLQLSGGNHLVNILAPNAEVRFASGLVTGNLIAGRLLGCGQVNLGGFEGDPWDDKKL